METKRKLVSILVPCYNEEQSLPLFYEEVTKVTQSIPQYDFEIFLVHFSWTLLGHKSMEFLHVLLFSAMKW